MLDVYTYMILYNNPKILLRVPCHLPNACSLNVITEMEIILDLQWGVSLYLHRPLNFLLSQFRTF